MVCEDPGADERLAELREAMRSNQQDAGQNSDHDPCNDKINDRGLVRGWWRFSSRTIPELMSFHEM
jgi:hypothetical protein